MHIQTFLQREQLGIDLLSLRVESLDPVDHASECRADAFGNLAGRFRSVLRAILRHAHSSTIDKPIHEYTLAFLLDRVLGAAIMGSTMTATSRCLVATLGGLLCLAPTVAPGQPRNQTAPHTAWGDPDLRGIWDYWTFTPLERPDEFDGRERLTDEEVATVATEANAAALARDAAAPPGSVGAYGQAVWTDRARATALTQSSLLVDPSDGKIPPLTPDATAATEAHDKSGALPVRLRANGISADGPDYRGVAERCLVGFSTGPPMLPGGYNNNVQIFQVPGYVVLLHEMVHDVRVVPLDDRPQLPSTIQQWLGSSRGHWEGDTLVIETTNFTNKTGAFNTTFMSWGSAENLRLTERLTRVNAETVDYEFTVNDPSTFARPFTGRFPLNRTDAPLYEYACHEGNHGMMNMLIGGRSEDRTHLP